MNWRINSKTILALHDRCMVTYPHTVKGLSCTWWAGFVPLVLTCAGHVWGLSNVLLIPPGTHRGYPIITHQPGPQTTTASISHLPFEKALEQTQVTLSLPIWSKGRMASTAKYRGLRTFGGINQFCPFSSLSVWPQSLW